MQEQPKSKRPRKQIVKKLRNKFRLVILNDQTFEERISLRLSPMNIFVIGGTVILSLITVTIYIIAFTPLREYIPGYADVGMKRKLIDLNIQTDSLYSKLQWQEAYIQNFNDVINGKTGISMMKDSVEEKRYDTILKFSRSKEDSLLRTKIESQRILSPDWQERSYSSALSTFYFFTPVKGTVSSLYNPSQKHYGVDIVSSPNEVIKVTLDGTVIFSNWTSETGYTIGIQHANNIFSVYKHNSALLKKEGDYVKAGEVIAIIGNTGELSSGPHLHFELWYNGNPVNPEDYMAF